MYARFVEQANINNNNTPTPTPTPTPSSPNGTRTPVNNQ